jgi:hypothetical protein
MRASAASHVATKRTEDSTHSPAFDKRSTGLFTTVSAETTKVEAALSQRQTSTSLLSNINSCSFHNLTVLLTRNLRTRNHCCGSSWGKVPVAHKDQRYDKAGAGRSEENASCCLLRIALSTLPPNMPYSSHTASSTPSKTYPLSISGSRADPLFVRSKGIISLCARRGQSSGDREAKSRWARWKSYTHSCQSELKSFVSKNSWTQRCKLTSLSHRYA